MQWLVSFSLLACCQRAEPRERLHVQTPSEGINVSTPADLLAATQLGHMTTQGRDQLISSFLIKTFLPYVFPTFSTSTCSETLVQMYCRVALVSR